VALGHDVSHSSAHAPEMMKPEQKQEQPVTMQQEIAPEQERVTILIRASKGASYRPRPALSYPAHFGWTQ